MSILTPATEPKRPIGVVRFLFPFVVVGIAAAIVLTAGTAWGADMHPSSRSMVQTLTVVIAAALLFLWALRMPGWRKRYVWLTALVAVGLAAARSEERRVGREGGVRR